MYSIVSGPLPVADYIATMKVNDLVEGKCEVQWSSTSEAKGAPEAEKAKNSYLRNYAFSETALGISGPCGGASSLII